MPRIFLLTTLFLALSVSASAQTLQNKYDSGEKALGQGKYEDAAVIFTDVYRRLSPRQRDSLVGGQIRFRLGKSLVMTSQFRAAVVQLELAIPVLDRSGKAVSAETAEAHYFLGLAYEALGEMALAVEQQKIAVIRTDLPQYQQARLALARSAIFVDRPLARDLFRQLIEESGQMAADSSSNDKLGELMAMRSRVELNDKKPVAARNLAELALQKAGGTGTKVSLSDIRLRGDLSIASFLSGDQDRGISMLAWTGIGRVASPEFPEEGNIVLPDCTPSGVVDRDDMVIVDISIADDGTVTYVRPIYSTRPGKIEAAFADAIYQWQWTQEKLKTVDPLWRAALRVELRCSTSGDRRWIGQSYSNELWDALNSLAAETKDSSSDRQQSSSLRGRLDSLEATGKGNSAEALTIVLSLIRQDRLNRTDPDDHVQHAFAIADGLPLSPRNRAIVRVLVVSQLDSTLQTSRYVQGAEPDWPVDVRAWFDAEMGLRAERREADVEARKRYEAVVQSGLSRTNPLVQFAALRLATLYFAERDVGKASRLIEESGLKPDQCSLLDAGPISKSLPITSRDYPPKALDLGFSGWTMIATDVGVDGRPVKPRTVFAFPPFLFDQAIERGMARARFKPIYREGQKIGCMDFRQRIRFSIPK